VGAGDPAVESGCETHPVGAGDPVVESGCETHPVGAGDSFPGVKVAGA